MYQEEQAEASGDEAGVGAEQTRAVKTVKSVCGLEPLMMTGPKEEAAGRDVGPKLRNTDDEY